MPPQNSKIGTVRITYYHQDQPRAPVSIITSLTVPPWQMLEMAYDATSSTADTSVYVIDFHNVAAGRYQYKFRVGHGCEDGGDEEPCWVLDEGAEVVEDDAGHKNSLLVVEETVDGPEVSDELRDTLEGTAAVNEGYIDDTSIQDHKESKTSMIEDRSSRQRSGSSFSHKDLGETSYPKADPVIEDVDGSGSKEKPITDVSMSTRFGDLNGDDIFSSVGNSSSALNISSRFAIDKDNVHIASPRPRSTPRVIRKARSEILSRTTNIRPPLHQIIEEDSGSDVRSPRNSSASYSSLLSAAKAPSYEVTRKSGQDSVAEQGSQENASGIRQRKVSGGTSDSHDVQSRDGDGDQANGSGHNHNNNNPPTPSLATGPAPEEQQQKDGEGEDGNQSLFQWLLGCLRRRSTRISFILALAALSALALTFFTLRSIH